VCLYGICTLCGVMCDSLDLCNFRFYDVTLSILYSLLSSLRLCGICNLICVVCEYIVCVLLTVFSATEWYV